MKANVIREKQDAKKKFEETWKQVWERGQGEVELNVDEV